MGVHEGGVTLGQNCCQVTAKSDVFDCTSTPGTLLVLTGVFFLPVLISTVPEMIVKRAELISCSVNCSPSKETNINLPRKSIFSGKTDSELPQNDSKAGCVPERQNPTAFVGTGLLTKYPDAGNLTPFCCGFQKKAHYSAIFQR